MVATRASVEVVEVDSAITDVDSASVVAVAAVSEVEVADVDAAAEDEAVKTPNEVSFGIEKPVEIPTNTETRCKGSVDFIFSSTAVLTGAVPNSTQEGSVYAETCTIFGTGT